jgi:hypothetical protein
MNTVPMPSGDSNFNGYSQDQYNEPDPTSAGIWYGDMYEQVYNSYYEWGSLETWAYANYYNKWKAGESYEQYKDIYELYVYAAECRYYLQNYFWTYFTYDGKSVSPRYYDFSYEGHNHHTFSWKGYFAYNYVYYIDWMYKAYLGKAATYYKNHPNDYNNEVWWGGQSYGKYSDHCANMKYYMHGLENVEYGYDSTDTSGYHDWHLPLMETSAGF